MTKQFYLYMQLKTVHVHLDTCVSDHRAFPGEVSKQSIMHDMHTTWVRLQHNAEQELIFMMPERQEGKKGDESLVYRKHVYCMPL